MLDVGLWMTEAVPQIVHRSVHNVVYGLLRGR
jgi:hypothetical protein